MRSYIYNTARIKVLIYCALIDPLLGGLRKEIIKLSGSPKKIIDIACGPGTLATMFAENRVMTTAVDLDEDFIGYANELAEKKGMSNLRFEIRDASDLSVFKNGEFDVAVTSMSVHQFDAELAVSILTEMKRIAGMVVVGDYNYPLPSNYAGFLAKMIEWMAGGEHHSNFRTYNKLGGLNHFISAAGLNAERSSVRGNGVFRVIACR